MLFTRFFIIITLLTAMFLHTQGQENFRYSVTGTVYDHSYDGLYAYLKKDSFYSGTTSKIDSVKIKNGKFNFRGKLCELPHLYQVVISNRLRHTQIILEAGKINVHFDKDSEQISGTPINDQYNKDIIIPNRKLKSILDSLTREKSVKPGDLTAKDKAEYARALPKEELKKLSEGKLHFVKTYANYPVVDIFVFEMMLKQRKDPELPGIQEKLSEESKQRLNQMMEKFRR